MLTCPPPAPLLSAKHSRRSVDSLHGSIPDLSTIQSFSNNGLTNQSEPVSAPLLAPVAGRRPPLGSLLPAESLPTPTRVTGNKRQRSPSGLDGLTEPVSSECLDDDASDIQAVPQLGQPSNSLGGPRRHDSSPRKRAKVTDLESEPNQTTPGDATDAHDPRVSFRVVTILKQSVNLTIHRDHTVGHVKQLLGPITNMDTSCLVLVLNGLPLVSDSFSLAELGVSHGSVILARYPRSSLQMSATGLNGRAIPLVLGPGDTLATLKSTLCSKADFPVYSTSSPCLQLLTNTLSIDLSPKNDSKTLSELGLDNGSAFSYMPLTH